MKAELYNKRGVFCDLAFPLELFYYNQTRKQLHYHSFYELVIVRNGSGKHVVENFTYPISIGDVFVIKPKVKHYYSNLKNLTLINILYCPDKLNIPLYDIQDVPGYCILFEVEPLLRTKKQFKSRLNLDIEQLEIVDKLSAKIHKELSQKSRGYRFFSLVYFMELISYLSRCYTPYDSKSVKNLKRVSEMLNFIDNNFQEKITLNDIVIKGHMSLSTANRAFQEAMELTPIEYLIKIRIDHAASMLRHQHDIPITRVAMQCGYNDSNHFSKQFSKVMRTTPRDYRKMFISTKE